MSALVGPLRKIWFSGPWPRPPRYYDLPRNTLDIRYEACAAHHPACDCREAMIAELLAEHKQEFDALHNAILDAIKGHNTWPAGESRRPDEFAACKCSACGIARAAQVGYWEFKRQRDEARQSARRRVWMRANRATLCPRYPYDLDEVPF